MSGDQPSLPLSDRAGSGARLGSGGIALSDRQRIAWLRLWRTENVGPVTFRQLINHFGTAEAALEALPEMAARGGMKRSQKIMPVSMAEDEIASLQKIGAKLCGLGEPDYPVMLRRTGDAPALVSYLGEPAVFQLPALAVVGSRNASLAGVRFTRKLAAETGAQGYAIVSGLARGIDTAAHEATLGTGTIAVLAGGLDHPYPPENLELFKSIPARGGAVITEMPMGWEPRAKDFPRRNRIIAALGLGLLVVEAAQRSGSLISARLANELGRTVFAVPGSPLDPRCEGTNNLIKNGATVVTDVRDILDALAPMTDRGSVFMPTAEEPSSEDFSATHASESDRQRIVDALGPTPVHIDELITYAGVTPAQAYLVLLELDLAGRLQRHSGGSVSLLYV
ncbi:MAG: DNA-processing protein DprA [Rhizobiaceae bacterium]